MLLVCAAPVVASYFTYFVIRPNTRTNYSELIVPPRAVARVAAAGRSAKAGAVRADALKGQWLLVVVSGGACDAVCERHLWIQRQLREALGAERDRVDKVWLIDDAAAPRARRWRRSASAPADGALRRPTAQLAALAVAEPAPATALEDHLYIVDPRGDWMMRVPANPDPARLKRDIERLLRASAGWDRPGR